MTSKQAKKAHQLATRGPRVSRAEQRRQEAEELARQKKEWEREKAAAKAKAVREKKTAKEQAERDVRKQMGLPEPSRFVRASQPTISRFVKKGNKRTWLEMDILAEESDTTTVGDNEEYDLESEHPAKKVKAAGESEDEYGGFPSFSQSELGVTLEQVDNFAASESKQEDGTDPGLTATLEPERRPAGLLPVKDSSDEFPRDFSENIDDMAATQLLSEAADAAARSPQQGVSIIWTAPKMVPPRPVTYVEASPSISKIKLPHIYAEPATTTRPVLHEQSVNMLPPPLPVQVEQKRVISFAPSPPKPRTMPRLHPQPISKAALPPSATQAFIENHLDDFFPSPSQEIRELLDDIDDLPSNTQIARELEPELVLPTKVPKEDSFADLICTQDFILSSQDIFEITTPCPPAPIPKFTELPESTPTPLSMKPSARQPKRRFFEEKDEDLLHAAIQESKALACREEKRELERISFARVHESRMAAPKKDERRQEEKMLGRTKRAFGRTLSNATDYGEDEFHDCEEELLALC
jgi:hypothetical protein